MMPSGQVEKIADAGGRLSPETTQLLVALRSRGQRRPGLDVLVGGLSRRLLIMDTTDCAPALLDVLNVLGRGLGADHVGFYFPTVDQGLFEMHSQWDRPGRLAADATIPRRLALDSLWDGGTGLVAGEATHVGGVLPNRLVALKVSAPDVKQSVRRKPVWSSSRSSLYLPCLGPAGLIGVIAVEGGLSSSRWTERQIEEATSAGRSIAEFLARHQLAAELEALRGRQVLDERLETLGRVAGSVAHDFNNVLTAILGYADLLGLELGEDGPGQGELGEIRSAATRAADLVEEVLSFGRRRSSQANCVDLADLLTKLEGMVQRVTGHKIQVQIDIEPNLEGGLAPIDVDSGRLERVILNLASNARDAVLKSSPGGGHFELRARRVTISAGDSDSIQPGEYVVLTATDDGCGIEPAVRDRIFEPFFTTRDTGTGLGLATVAEVLREASGSIRIDSTLGAGTAIHLYFPISDQPRPI